MKKFCCLLFLLPLTAHAVSEFDLERLERSCRLQQESLLKSRNGTPACKEWQQAKKNYTQQQRAQRTAQHKQQAAQERTQRAEQQRKAKPKALKNGEGSGYRWNGNENRYCQHNAKGIPTECY